MNSTFYEKMLENLLTSLEHYLPIFAGKIIVFLLICFIWPKITKFLLKTIEKTMSLRHNDPLLISFLKSLIKTLMYIALAFVIIGIIGIKATSLVTI